MQCGICKAETQSQKVTYTEDIDRSVIVIRNVPAAVCTECGNVWYSGTVAAQLEAIVNRIIGAMIAEVAVVNYPEHAA
ncbi:MAG: YgiT-type zinc finger protein [Planctomycetota bacterium]|jgi:YgiT-type zinc finger domain-containing protein|nr:YgiT-type zinc finger protein [Planctomycetota bacterium]